MVPAVYLSSTQLSCPTPPVAQGLLTANQLLAAVDVTINGAAYTGLPLSFLYERLPLIASISPQVGAAAGGTAVVLSTTDATGFGAGCCSFDLLSPPRAAYVVPLAAPHAYFSAVRQSRLLPEHSAAGDLQQRLLAVHPAGPWTSPTCPLPPSAASCPPPGLCQAATPSPSRERDSQPSQRRSVSSRRPPSCPPSCSQPQR